MKEKSASEMCCENDHQCRLADWKDLPVQIPSKPVIKESDRAMSVLASAKMSKVEKYFIAILNRNLMREGISVRMLASLAFQLRLEVQLMLTPT